MTRIKIIFVVVCVEITLIFLLWTAYLHSRVSTPPTRPTSPTLSSHSRQPIWDESTDRELMKQILRLAHEIGLTTNDTNVDVVHRNNEVHYFSRLLPKSQRIPLPSKWCGQDEAIERLNASKMVQRVLQCFRGIEFPESKKTMIAHALRLTRDTFRREGVPLVMVYGSLLGSLRYHTRTPFDSDYDMAVPVSKMTHALTLFMRMASDVDNGMRVFDMRRVTGCMQIGMGCERNDSWRDAKTWSSLGVPLHFRDGVPTASSWHPYQAMMNQCTVYMDIYPTMNTAEVFRSGGFQGAPHRPLEGTLFPTVAHPRDFLERVYAGSIDLCVPKVHYLLQGTWHTLPQICRQMTVPCSWLDSLHPRVLVFTPPTSSFVYELGLEGGRGGEGCWLRSLYFYRK